MDYCYASLWDKSDNGLIQYEYRDGPAVWDKLKRFYNDQTVYFTKVRKRFEPLDIRLCIDQITDDALFWMVDIHTGRSNETPRYISVGTSTTTPDRTDHQLVAEIDRQPILDTGGYIDTLGHNELYGILFPFAQANILCAEAGLHLNSDATSGDLMICRNKFNPALQHDANQNALGINICIQHRAF